MKPIIGLVICAIGVYVGVGLIPSLNKTASGITTANGYSSGVNSMAIVIIIFFSALIIFMMLRTMKTTKEKKQDAEKSPTKEPSSKTEQPKELEAVNPYKYTDNKHTYIDNKEGTG